MTTDKQIEANRRNAQNSTGPTTGEGKQASKMNATKHGLTAETVVIKDEDPEVFDALRNDLIREFAPETTLEFQLVDRMASTLWRLRRVPHIEASLMEVYRLEVESIDARNAYFPAPFSHSVEEEDDQREL